MIPDNIRKKIKQVCNGDNKLVNYLLKLLEFEEGTQPNKRYEAIIEQYAKEVKYNED